MRVKPILREMLFRWTKVQLPLLEQGAPTLEKDTNKRDTNRGKQNKCK
jgi:hypothetical protein